MRILTHPLEGLRGGCELRAGALAANKDGTVTESQIDTAHQSRLDGSVRGIVAHKDGYSPRLCQTAGGTCTGVSVLSLAK